MDVTMSSEAGPDTVVSEEELKRRRVAAMDAFRSAITANEPYVTGFLALPASDLELSYKTETGIRRVLAPSLVSAAHKPP